MLDEVAASFVLGLLTPLTAVCVLPLYPGFIAHLTGRLDEDADRWTYALSGVLVVAGVLSFMLLIGLVFSTLLQRSLTAVIGVVSPVAFGLLGLYGLALLAGRNPVSRLGRYGGPRTDSPLVSGFGFGFFFGAIVLPCNPAFIAVFFARSVLFTDPVTSLLRFGAFGLGMGAPLLVFAVASARWSRRVIGFLTRHERVIEAGSGLVMLGVAVYYLVAVFHVI